MLERILLATLLSLGALSAESNRITVVYTSEAQPYVEALDGLRGSIGNSSVAAVDLHSPNAQADLTRLLEGGLNRLVVTIGKDALEAVIARKLDTPMMATMVMQSELAGKRVVTGVRLDIPVTAILAELKTMFPQKNRVAILHNPGIPNQLDAGTLARAHQQGFVAQLMDSSSPEESLRVLRSLKGRVDFVVCLPDSAMYNSATVKPLILAALESHLPMVGFSQNFVRAGAAIGVYPDFRDVGAQTGEIAQKQLSGQAAGPVDGPRKFIVGVNQRVMRLLGLEYREGGAVVTVR
jgi:putative tryptophan/tyrosine transport system substrate-binding protein